MFTVGIFTTHIPYLAFIAFYTWFLLFGVEHVHEGKVRIAEKTILIEHHRNHTKAVPVSVYHFFKRTNYQPFSLKKFIDLTITQKWKPHYILFVKQDCCLNSSYCRPPPQNNNFTRLFN